MNRRWRVIALGLIVIAVGCTRQEPSSAPPPDAAAAAPAASPAAPAKPGLGGRAWSAEQVNGAPLALPANARAPSIEFDTATKTASGFAGCNTFQGAYRRSGDSLHLGPFATTRRACAELDAVEHAFLAALAQTQSVRVTKDTLEFLGGDGAVLVRFKPRGY